MAKIAFLLALACAACSSTPSSPSSSELLSGTWRIASIQVAAQPAEPAPAGATYEVTFEGSRISARVDCNACSGSFLMNGSSLMIGPSLACTRAACATAAFENAVVNLLPGTHQLSTTATTMTLNSGRGSVTLARR
jgi:heat shock protein HslJ